jgi:cysteine synthase
LICDSGDRYADTYFDDAWLVAHDLQPGEHAESLRSFERDGSWTALTSVSVP